MAAKELKLMPTTEGGLDFKLNMTQLLDGYPGHEHSLPIYPIYKDVVHSVAESKMAVTPTLWCPMAGHGQKTITMQPNNPTTIKSFNILHLIKNWHKNHAEEVLGLCQKNMYFQNMPNL